jgi:hypothetical protein
MVDRQTGPKTADLARRYPVTLALWRYRGQPPHAIVT